LQPNNPIDFYFSHFDTIRKKHGVETPKPKKKKKKKKKKKGKKQGVCHSVALPFT
jgi:hypothetical protein